MSAVIEHQTTEKKSLLPRCDENLPYSGECKGGFPDVYDTAWIPLTELFLIGSLGARYKGALPAGWRPTFWNVQSEDGHGVVLPIRLCGLRETERRMGKFSEMSETHSVVASVLNRAIHMFIHRLPCANSERCTKKKCKCQPVDKEKRLTRKMTLDDVRPFIRFSLENSTSLCPHAVDVLIPEYFALERQFGRLWCNREEMMKVDRCARIYVRTSPKFQSWK